jgi:Zn-dependent metalloprotease
MARALERHNDGSAYVIPVILTPVFWQPAPFGKLQALPKDAKAIALWSPRNAGWTNVVEGIVRTVTALKAGQELERTTTQPVTAVFPKASVATTTYTRVAERAGAHPNRVIYDAGNEQNLPGRRVRVEGDPESGDAAVDEAYTSLGQCYYFLWDVLERDSIDNQGMQLSATVHYARGYDNCFWNGTQIIAGDGDGVLFRRFTGVDAFAFELAKGVIGAEGNLNYQHESGALLMAVAGVLSCLVKQYALKQTAVEADWLVGSSFLAPGVKGRALHSLAAPGTAYDDPALGKDPQPAHMNGYVHTKDDNGGVHTNSGIPGHAFYLTAIALGGYAWEKAGRIWYGALCDKRIRPNATFKAFAKLTVDCAASLFGRKSVETEGTQYGWRMVGIDAGISQKSSQKSAITSRRRPR